MKTSNHQLWLEAHYALGKLEKELGTPLDWKSRREFIINYIEENREKS